MEKRKMYGVVAAIVVIIIVVAAAVWYTTNDNGSPDDDPILVEMNDYYFYLDGMGDLDGWYSAEEENAEEALKAALDEAEVPYEINSGWITSIGDYVNGADLYFGTYVYTSTTVENAYPTYFCTSTVLNEIDGNIIYISYTTYTSDPETFVTTYALNPTTTESDMMTTGPFASSDYQPLDYSDTYWFYLDGMGDLDGWYTATGENAETALGAALDRAELSYEINDGWVSRIGDYVNGADLYFGTYVYTSTTVENAYATYFGQGSVLDETIGNIFYIPYTSFIIDEVTNVVTYELNPTTTESDMMTTGPFTPA